MRERPILFSGPMVRALLEERKTVTRRVVKPQPAPNSPHDGGTRWVYQPEKGLHIPVGTVGHLTVAEKMGLRCPYGQPGGQLWVRETWALEDCGADGERVIWQADREAAWRSDLFSRFYLPSDYTPPRWRPSIHMPRWASRLTLEVVSVRVERLHDITEEDADREGALADRQRAEESGVTVTADFPSARRAFQRLWTSINGAESWAANPWVWRVEFRRVEVPTP